MSSVASRELRNQTRALLDRVAAGERITITVDGRPAAVLGPVEARSRWMPAAAFARLLAANQADSGLRDDLRELAPDTTDDLPL
jgi:prevent-host-death family protein